MPKKTVAFLFLLFLCLLKNITLLGADSTTTKVHAKDIDQILLNAICDDNIQSIEISVKLGANPNVQDPYKYTPLHIATCLAKESAIAALLAANADPTLQDNDGFTPLHRAIQYKASDKSFDLLLRAMSKKTTRKETHPLNFTATTNGYTALMLAVLHKNLHAVKKLLECPEVDRTIKTAKKDLATHLAVKQLAQAEKNFQKLSEKLYPSAFENKELSELKKTVETYTQIKALFDKQIVREKRTYKRKECA